MQLSRKYITKDGEKFVAFYRGEELLVIVPQDDRSREIFKVYQKLEDEAEERKANDPDREKRLDASAFNMAFQNWFRVEWTRTTATLKARYGDQLGKVKIVLRK